MEGSPFLPLPEGMVIDQIQVTPSQLTVVVISTLIGMALNFTGLNPMRALVWVAVINGLLMGPLLTLILLIANNRQVMGNRTNGRPLNVLGAFTAAAGYASAISLAVTWFSSR